MLPYLFLINGGDFVSREIKFRAWKKENSPEMIHTVSSIDWANKEISFRYRLNSWTFRDDKESLDNIILMQYTGLKDKNGVEVYEGDVVEADIAGIDTYKIVFVKGRFTMQSIIGGKDSLWLLNEECEIKGNIYENPELPEATK